MSHAPDPTIAPRRVGATTWLALILTLAAVVRVYSAINQSLWADDVFSLIASAGHPINVPLAEGFLPPEANPVSLRHAAPITDVWRNQWADIHPPGYFIILRVWREMFGDSDFALRSLSILCSVIAIAALFCAARETLDDRTALWACLFMAIAFGPVALARDVRQQSMLVMWGTLALAVLVRIDARGPTWGRAIALTLLVWLMSQTHYFFVGGGVAMAAYALGWLRGPRRLVVLACLAIAGVMFLLASGPFLRQQLGMTETISGWLAEEPRWHVARTIRRVLALPMTQLSRTDGLPVWIAPLGGVVLIAPLWWLGPRRGLGSVLERAWKARSVHLPLAVSPREAPIPRRNRKRQLGISDFPYTLHPASDQSRRGTVMKQGLALWWLWTACIIGIVVMSDLAKTTRQLDQPRYTILAVPGIVVLAAFLAARCPGRWRTVATAAVVICCLWGVIVLNTPGHNRFANQHRRMAELLTAKAGPGDVIVFVAPKTHLWWPRVMLATFLHYNPNPRQPLMTLHVPPSPEILARLPDARLWLVHRSEIDASNLIPGRETVFTENLDTVCGVRGVDRRKTKN